MERHYEQSTLTRKVTELSQCEVFVFASDFQGNHTRSAARYACKNFGAVQGTLGPQGKCYAIPVDMANPDAMKPYVNEFITYVKDHPANRFLITRMGNERAAFDSEGFSTNEKDELMGELFKELEFTPNAVLPIEWQLMMAMPDSPVSHKEKIDFAVDEEYLKKLCKKYRYEIGAGVKWNLPEITICYISGKECGNAQFGDFFFYKDELYVFTHEAAEDPKMKKVLHPHFCAKLYDAFIHDRTDILIEAYDLFGKRTVTNSINYYNEKLASVVVKKLFHDECWNQGNARKVIFAGM